MGAAVVVTSSSSGRRPRGCRCTKPRSIFVVGLAATFPGFGVGRTSSVTATPREMSGPTETNQRRGHRYSGNASDRGPPPDYLDPRCVIYVDRSLHHPCLKCALAFPRPASHTE